MKVLLLDRLETAAVGLTLNTCLSTSTFLTRLETGWAGRQITGLSLPHQQYLKHRAWRNTYFLHLHEDEHGRQCDRKMPSPYRWSTGLQLSAGLSSLWTSSLPDTGSGSYPHTSSASEQSHISASLSHPAKTQTQGGLLKDSGIKTDTEYPTSELWTKEKELELQWSNAFTGWQSTLSHSLTGRTGSYLIAKKASFILWNVLCS